LAVGVRNSGFKGFISHVPPVAPETSGGYVDAVVPIG
jgi:hypothetical protein